MPENRTGECGFRGPCNDRDRHGFCMIDSPCEDRKPTPVSRPGQKTRRVIQYIEERIASLEADVARYEAILTDCGDDSYCAFRQVKIIEENWISDLKEILKRMENGE